MTDTSFNALSSTLTVSLNDGTFINLPAPSALNLTGAFAGFTSDVGISSLKVEGPLSSTVNAYPTVTSLYVGTGSTASVPEPSSFALISVIGLLGLVYRKRMKK
ncbi:MAG: PEP-CTERM sorting domain-containing protein [Planctomycetales bacterium]|nr:PEP-CTERM sorting domain-containing protein [Planctomycetales bacterium]